MKLRKGDQTVLTMGACMLDWKVVNYVQKYCCRILLDINVHLLGVAAVK